MMHSLLISLVGLASASLPVAILVGIAVGIAYIYALRRWKFAADHKAQIEAAAATVFHIVENMKLQGKLAEDQSKTEVAVVELKRILERQNLPVTDQVIDAAKDIWDAMHGAQGPASASDPSPTATPVPSSASATPPPAPGA